ncbi:TetR/AcrR family transcriptional regulator [Yinghuangia seranimata]|uniref:TetR/AcrR family transcriptional regulator n=1 Tax=Yinghuangia seranimata TaxID=408067 RepID=UPI00248BAB76|nr:TetR/AcrR family transcriptional regulator [Yinghuangia seranimata]MDI2126166.1 TetR/AcrR family transcriptional regulator [Yinghuangia seranimata]
MSKTPAAPVRSKRAGAQLTPDAIIEASLRIAARGSADAFTIRRLGEELGADPTAIYRHFRDKDELLLSVFDRSLGEVLASIPPGLDWKDRLRALAAGSLAVALKYPAVAGAMTSRTTRRANEFHVVELILGAVTEAGLSGAEAVVHYRMFGDSVLAFVGQRAEYLLLEPDAQASDDAAWTVEYRRVDAREFPHITALGAELAAVTHDQIFHTRVEALISAVELRAEQLRDA